LNKRGNKKDLRKHEKLQHRLMFSDPLSLIADITVLMLKFINCLKFTKNFKCQRWNHKYCGIKAISRKKQVVS